MSEIYKYIPMNHSLVIRDIDRQIRTLLAVLPVAMNKKLSLEVEFEARLFSFSEREAIPLDTAIVDLKEGEENTHILILRIDWPDLKPGSYEMEVEASEKETGSSSSVRKRIVIL